MSLSQVILTLKKSESVSHLVLSDSWQSHRLWPTKLLCPWNSLGKNTRVGCHSILQGIFPIQGLLLFRQILYCLSHQGSLSKSVSIIWNWKHPKWFNQKAFLLVVVQWLRFCTSKAVGGGFDPWSGNQDPTCRVVWQNKSLLKNLFNPFTSISMTLV